MSRPLIAAALLAATLAPAGTGAHAADAFVEPPILPVSPCNDTAVLDEIVENFEYQVRNVPDLPDVGIAQITDFQERSFIPADYKRPVARRWCEAQALLSNGFVRDLWYLIEYQQGFAGLVGSGVQSCVSGFDRWNVYNEACRVLRSSDGYR